MTSLIANIEIARAIIESGNLSLLPDLSTNQQARQTVRMNAPFKMLHSCSRIHRSTAGPSLTSMFRSSPCFPRLIMSGLRLPDRSLGRGLHACRRPRALETIFYPPKRFRPTSLSSSRYYTTYAFTPPVANPEATSSVRPSSIPNSLQYWLFGCSALVLGILVIGGLTRLTESGLSITEWQPITGILPPITSAEWDTEWEKYKVSPEGVL